MPRAYWLYPKKEILTSCIMLIEPSAKEFARVWARVEKAGRNDYDMEIVNDLYRDSALVLPHRPYSLLVQEYRETDHSLYLGSPEEEWDPVAAFKEAKFLHWSDWPMSKPWHPSPVQLKQQTEPKCHMKNGVETCGERDMWRYFYREFRERRQVGNALQSYLV